MSKNILTYSIATELLRGTITNQEFIIHTLSGGRRGSTTPGAPQHTPASYDSFRQTRHDKGVHGGPLPPGIYICRYVANHHKFHECIFLDRTLTAMLRVDSDARIRIYPRDNDFFIHGAGPHGSDGCLVPSDEPARVRLNRAVRDCNQTVMLEVVDPGFPLPAMADLG